MELAVDLCREHGIAKDQCDDILKDMQRGSYAQFEATFLEHFGLWVTLVEGPPEKDPDGDDS